MWLHFKVNDNVATLTAGLCALGCYILTCSTEQFRLLTLGQHVSKVLSAKGQFMMMTLSLGGVSIYAMNFLNLAAISLTLPETDSIPENHILIEFKAVPLGISVFIACFLSFLGLYVASKDLMFAKTKKEIVESFVSGAKNLSMKEVKAISSFKIFYVIATQKLGRLVLAGFITGCGATATACLAQWSLAIPDILPVWHVGDIIGAGLFCWFFAFVAFWILFRLLSLYPRKEILRIASAVFMAFSFVLSHYLIMDGISIKWAPGFAADDSKSITGSDHISQTEGFYIILVSVIVFCFVLLVLTVVDLRSWLYESSHWVARHEAMLQRLKGMHTDNFTIIAKYLRDVELERSHHSSSPSKLSALNRSVISSASEAVGSLVKHLPTGRGNKVTPRSVCEAGEDNGSTLSSSYPPSPRPHASSHSSGRVAVFPATVEEGPSSDPPASSDAVFSNVVAVDEEAAAALSMRPAAETKDDGDVEAGAALIN